MKYIYFIKVNLIAMYVMMGTNTQHNMHSCKYLVKKMLSSLLCLQPTDTDVSPQQASPI